MVIIGRCICCGIREPNPALCNPRMDCSVATGQIQDEEHLFQLAEKANLETHSTYIFNCNIPLLMCLCNLECCHFYSTCRGPLEQILGWLSYDQVTSCKRTGHLRDFPSPYTVSRHMPQHQCSSML